MMEEKQKKREFPKAEFNFNDVPSNPEERQRELEQLKIKRDKIIASRKSNQKNTKEI